MKSHYLLKTPNMSLVLIKGLKTKHWIKYDKIVAVHFPKEDDKKPSEEDLSKEDEEEEETSETTSKRHISRDLWIH